MDEGDGPVQVCMHFGGEALTASGTFYIIDGSALSKLSDRINIWVTKTIEPVVLANVCWVCMCVCVALSKLHSW